MSLGRVLARTTIGGLFVAHGSQKLFGWFSGAGLEGTAQFMGAVGLRPPKAHATAAGAAELSAGTALALGVLTPLPNAALIAVMLTAVRTVHGRNGPWATDQGWEYNAVMIGALLALADDEARAEGERPGQGALVALGLGLAGAAAAKLVSDAFPESDDDGSPAGDEGSPAAAPETATASTDDGPGGSGDASAA